MDDLRGDVQALTDEVARARDRLHKLEGTTSGLVLTAKVRADVAAENAAQQVRWLRLLTAVITVAGVIGPLVYAGVGR